MLKQTITVNQLFLYLLLYRFEWPSDVEQQRYKTAGKITSGISLRKACYIEVKLSLLQKVKY